MYQFTNGSNLPWKPLTQTFFKSSLLLANSKAASAGLKLRDRERVFNMNSSVDYVCPGFLDAFILEISIPALANFLSGDENYVGF